ncbi:MAG: Peptidyl-prolyl cis-trans isomerase cyp6 [Chrysothrix sp. TS-e1954]|nr:MAG: Peptidyl-prolyl cis-trans isomerase cyp6 [Chrysothrix sp. TS-e1954]
MSVLLETSLGDITIDLLVDYAPQACENFLKLCKIKYYNYAPIHTVQPNFSLQTGDPIGPGSKGSDGGSSVWGVLQGPSKRTFPPEFHAKLKHTERGTVSFATVPSKHDEDQREAGSQFIITLGDSLDDLDDKAAIFGRVVEGFDTLEKINTAFVDDNGRPLKDIRIRHTTLLDEADISDPPGLVAPQESPVPSAAQLATVRIADDEELRENMDQEAVEKLRREREARAQALTLEMVGDLPFAEVAPPENVLFVCKLNPVTQDDNLELIFSRFGKILSCEVIREKRTGDSLQYAFIEFAERKSCEMAYEKMQAVLIDDHRIHVDFSQSVSRLADVWRDASNKNRVKNTGGFGGIESLEKKRQYRAQEDRPKAGKYGMMFNERTNDRTSGSSNHARESRDWGSRRNADEHNSDKSRRNDRYRQDKSREYEQRRYKSRSRSPRRRSRRSPSPERHRHRR